MTHRRCERCDVDKLVEDFKRDTRWLGGSLLCTWCREDLDEDEENERAALGPDCCGGANCSRCCG